MNPVPPRQKVSKVERILDIAIIVILGIQVLVAFVIAILAGIFNKSRLGGYNKLIGDKPNEFSGALLAFISFLILSCEMAPIVLIFFIETIRMTLAVFISQDEFAYDSGTSSYPVTLNSGIIEDLGQVKYIVSDKTGTLTTNMF